MSYPLNRNGRIAFYGVKLASGGYSFIKMKDFSLLSLTKNPILLKRRYFDSKNEESFVSGFSPSFSYSFDFSPDNAVHKDIAQITDLSLSGADALRPILIVDTYSQTENARKYLCSVVPNLEGTDPNLYRFSGTFAFGGELETGSAVITSDGTSAIFSKSAP